MTPSVTVFGHTLIDVIFDLPKHYLRSHTNGEAITFPFGAKLSAGEYVYSPGGSGANVAVGLEKLGCSVALRTNISDDPFGEYLRESVNKSGVDLVDMPTKTATALSIVLRSGGQRTIITGGNQNFEHLDLQIPGTGWIHLGPLPEKSDEFLQKLTSHRLQSNQGMSMNPGMGQIEERSRVFLSTLKILDVIFLNLQEALRLTRLPTRSQINDIVRSIHSLGVKTVVVTDGEKGAYVGKDSRIWFGGAICDIVCRVDATGAGDAFASGFLAGLLSAEERMTDEEIQERCLKFGLLNSGAVVASVGGQNGLRTMAEIERDLQTVKLKVIK